MRVFCFLLVALQLGCGETGAVFADAYPKPDSASVVVDGSPPDATTSDAPVVFDAWPSAASCSEGTLSFPHRFLADDWGPIRHMTFDATHAYVGTGSPEYQVLRLPLNGGAAQVIAEAEVEGVAVDETDMYLIKDVALWTVPKTGGDLLRLTSSSIHPRAVTVDERDVYVVAVPGLRFWRFSKVDWTGTVLAQTISGVDVMTMTDTELFWSTGATRQIEKVAKTGGTPTILARHQDITGRLAVGAEGVYYTNRSRSNEPSFGAVRFVPAQGVAPDLFYVGWTRFATNTQLMMHSGNRVLEIDPITNTWMVAYNPGMTVSALVDEPDDAFFVYTGIPDWFVPGNVYHYKKSTDELIVLASDQYYPVDIHTDSTHVYFVNTGEWGMFSGSVNRVPRGGGPVEILVAGLRYPKNMVLDADTVYWVETEGGVVGSVPKAGGTPTLISGGHTSPVNLSLNAGALYWASYGDGRIIKFTLPTGPEEILVENQSNPNHLFVADGRVYWNNSRGMAEQPYSLLSMPADGGEIRALVEGGPDFWVDEIAVVGGYVYYGLNGGMYRVPIEGRGPETIEVGTTRPRGIGLSDQYVYWMNASTLRRRSRTGGPVEILTEAGAAWDVWYASGNLYWRGPGGHFCAAAD